MRHHSYNQRAEQPCRCAEQEDPRSLVTPAPRWQRAEAASHSTQPRRIKLTFLAPQRPREQAALDAAMRHRWRLTKPSKRLPILPVGCNGPRRPPNSVACPRHALRARRSTPDALRVGARPMKAVRQGLGRPVRGSPPVPGLRLAGPAWSTGENTSRMQADSGEFILLSATT
jgi:hypothetical protein